MTQQFFGKTFKHGLIAIAVLYAVAALGYYVGISAVLLLLIAIGAFAISLKRLEYGILFAFIELFSNAHGQLLSTEVSGFMLSLRMTIFAAVMSAWFVQLLRGRVRVSLNDVRLRQFSIVALAVVVGLFSGYLRNGFGAAFSDGNAYLYLGYLLPVTAINWTSELKSKLLQLLAAGATWSMGVSALVLYLFTHFNEVVLSTSYVFLRDLRIAEVTPIGGGVYRVFMQSHFFVGVFLLLLLSMLFQKRWSFKKVFPILSISIATLVLGLSRSFWVGFAGSLLVLFVLILWRSRPSISRWLQSAGHAIGSLVLGLVLIAVIVLFPIPNQSSTGSDLADALSKRATESGDAAVSSRWKLLDPMIESIKSNPILGSGYGTSVTFQSDDPRVREFSEDGTWTTVAMEWGWFELWVKMGILGPIGFLALAALMIKQLLAYTRTDQAWLGIGLISSIGFLYATHFFSPYLNHPIGLGFLLFCIPFLPNQQAIKVVESTADPLRVKTKVAAMATTIETS